MQSEQPPTGICKIQRPASGAAEKSIRDITCDLFVAHLVQEGVPGNGEVVVVVGGYEKMVGGRIGRTQSEECSNPAVDWELPFEREAIALEGVDFDTGRFAS